MIETVGLGGAENVVLQLAEELRNRGHRIVVVVPGDRAGWLNDQLKAKDFNWEAYDLRRVIDFGLPGRMAEMLRAHRVDVVHSHEFTASIYGTAATRKLRLPHVITMHGAPKMTRRFRRRVALRWAFRHSHATVAVSAETKRHLDEVLGLPPTRVQVVLNGIPQRRGDRDRVRGELALAEHDLLLLTVGSLIPRKGHAVLLDALARLDEVGDRRPWRLAVAGVGEERARLDRLVSSLGIEERVQFLGPRNDVPDLLAAADVFVMPSLWEGLPLAILEAMFARRPIVASRTSGIPEAIVHDRNGLLTPPGDVESLAAALRTIMGDPGLRERLAANARKDAEAKFTIDAMVNSYVNLYRTGLASSR